MLPCLCANKTLLATYAGCLAFDNRNTTTAVNYMMNYCEENGNVTVEKIGMRNRTNISF